MENNDMNLQYSLIIERDWDSKCVKGYFHFVRTEILDGERMMVYSYISEDEKLNIEIFYDKNRCFRTERKK